MHEEEVPSIAPSSTYTLEYEVYSLGDALVACWGQSLTLWFFIFKNVHSELIIFFNPIPALELITQLNLLWIKFIAQLNLFKEGLIKFHIFR